ncbi:hypothetical protein [Teredinibacter franksiae]|uniref:hypothetical protein n=1 Tax=Teredinibacter franksiae TaxID=2761453 RepID=UPI001628A9CA|nr:hypothetical protein [Teredinibacter franksiae]
MFEWLKFFPFEWHDDHKPAEVRGPYFSALRKNKWFLQDSLLYFGAPLANPVFGFSGRSSSVDAVLPGSANILKSPWQRVYNSGSDAPPSEWDYYRFYSNTWYFVGPWFTGYQAHLKASALLVKADKNGTFADKNLFHPKVFESAIANYLDTSYGYDRQGNKPKYRGPLHWRVLPISPSIHAVVCDIHEIGNGSKDNPSLHRVVYFPIAPQKMIRINFDFGGTSIYRDEVRAKPLFKLCDSIIDSLRLEVGAQTQAEWDKVKATCPDMSITETFGELPWPLKVEKARKKPKEVDITATPDAPGHQARINK